MRIQSGIVAAGLALACACSVSAQKPVATPAQSGARSVPPTLFQDVPRSHWAYDCALAWQKTGITIGYPDGTFGGKRAMTRYEFAVVAARLLPELEKLAAQKERGEAIPPITLQDLACLRNMIVTFRPELEALRVDVVAAFGDLDRLELRLVPVNPQAPISRDVPRGHWAYEAVQALALRGLVIGYPEMPAGKVYPAKP